MVANDPIGLIFSFGAIFLLVYCGSFLVLRRGRLRLLVLLPAFLALVALITYGYDQKYQMLIWQQRSQSSVCRPLRRSPSARFSPHDPSTCAAGAAGPNGRVDHQSPLRRREGSALQPDGRGEEAEHRAPAARSRRRPLQAREAGGHTGSGYHRNGRRRRVAGIGRVRRHGGRRRPRLRSRRDPKSLRARPRA